METIVRGSTTVKRLRSAGTLTMYLVSTKSLVQIISGDRVINDWTVPEAMPVIYPQARVSTSTSFVTNYKEVRWYYDGVEITEEDERFEITTFRIGTDDIPALKIKANLGLEIQSKKTILCEAIVDAGGYDEYGSANIEVSKQDSSSNTYYGAVDMTFGGVITTNNPEITLSPILYYGGAPVDIKKYTVYWYRLVANDDDGIDDGLELIQSTTGQSIILRQDDIDLVQTLYVVFRIGLAKVASTTIEVRDETDPYEIVFEFSNAGGLVDPNTGLDVTVKVITRNTGLLAPIFKQYAFALFNGVTKIRDQDKSTNNIFHVNYSDLSNNNVDSLRVEVEASDQ